MARQNGQLVGAAAAAMVGGGLVLVIVDVVGGREVNVKTSVVGSCGAGGVCAKDGALIQGNWNNRWIHRNLNTAHRYRANNTSALKSIWMRQLNFYSNIFDPV